MEYLFRGKRVDNGEWVKGSLLVGFTGIKYIVTLHDHILGITEMYEVLPETVGMWTGLTDENEKKIWGNSKVIWYGDSYDMKEDWRHGLRFYMGLDQLTKAFANELEVIEYNPELLEAK